VFCIGCAVRSVWPRVDVERICLWETWISVPFVGRVLATLAEVSFGLQFSMVICELARAVNYPKTQWYGKLVFWAICLAQCCCWMGVTTRRQVYHGVEESIWASVFTGIAVAFALLARAQPRQASVCKPGCDGYVKRVLCFSFPGIVAYVMFMVYVDVPMYLSRYHEDQLRGATYLWPSDGVFDMMDCKVVSKSMNEWASEMPWMSGYFVGATAFSLWLSHGPRFCKVD